MNRLRKLARLQREDRDLLCRALFAVVIVRLALWILPFKGRFGGAGFSLGAPSGPGLQPPSGPTVERLVWAIRNAARVVPFATCLTQSLALRRLLASAGYASQLHIGVAKDPHAGFQAHAWVEHDGAPLLSTHSELTRYSRLYATADFQSQQ